MANIQETTLKITELVKQFGTADRKGSHVFSDLKELHTKAGTFDGLFFSALENTFLIAKDFQTYLVYPGEESKEFHEVSEELQYQLESYLEWRLNLLQQLHI